MSLQSPTQESPRVRMTRNALQEGLLSLLEELPISRITISMVCLKAEVHRSTFYLYYKDIYDLLEHIQDTLYQELMKAITETPVYLPSTEMLSRVYKVVYQHKKLSRVLFGQYGDREFLRKVSDIYRNVLIDEWKKINKQLDARTLDYIHSFITFTNMGIMVKWVTNNFVESPEELAEMASRFLLCGISCFLSVPLPM